MNTTHPKLDRAEVCVLVLFIVFATGCAFVAGAAFGVQAALRLGICPLYPSDAAHQNERVNPRVRPIL